MNLNRFLAAGIVTGVLALGSIAVAQYQVPKPTLKKVAPIGISTVSLQGSCGQALTAKVTIKNDTYVAGKGSVKYAFGSNAWVGKPYTVNPKASITVDLTGPTLDCSKAAPGLSVILEATEGGTDGKWWVARPTTIDYGAKTEEIPG